MRHHDGYTPEDIHDVNEVEKVAVAARAKLHLEIVEPMGNEIFVYLQLPTVQETKHLVARLDARTPHEFSDEFECVIDVTRVHFFDNTTEKALV